MGNISELVQSILQNPEGYYVVVHNDEFPAGTLDGRLSEEAQAAYPDDLTHSTTLRSPG
jgi:hypothetical protein